VRCFGRLLYSMLETYYTNLIFYIRCLIIRSKRVRIIPHLLRGKGLVGLDKNAISIDTPVSHTWWRIRASIPLPLACYCYISILDTLLPYSKTLILHYSCLNFILDLLSFTLSKFYNFNLSTLKFIESSVIFKL